MHNIDYVKCWRQITPRQLGLFASGRKFLRNVTLNAAASTQKFSPAPFLRSLYCHYVFDDQVETFERLIVQLKAIGTFVDTDTLMEMLYGLRPIPGPCFHFSFDDGFRNVFSNAFPVLQRHKVPAIFFVPSGLVSAGPELARHYCLETTRYSGVIELVRWEELHEMMKAGIEIGSHTRTHARFSEMSGDSARLRDEVHGSKSELERNLGGKCRFISWPYGTRRDANAVSLEAVSAAGYTACFGAFRGQIRPHATDPLRIPRHHFETNWTWKHIRYFAFGGYER